MEQKIHRQMLTADLQSLVVALESKDTALKALEALTKDSDKSPDGPVKLGSASSLSAGNVIGKLAGAYSAAFHASKQAMPYFTATE
jgi:hypothetical protein